MSSYAYTDKHGAYHGPVGMRDSFRGVRGWAALTDEQRAEKRWYPCTVVNAEFDATLETRSGPTWHWSEGQLLCEYTVTPIPVETLIARRCSEVDALRDSHLAAGVAFDFPDGTGTVQTRSLEDSRNIQANASAAQMYLMAGQPEAVMQFRDMENVVHSLTAQQMLDMCAYVMGHGQGLYATSWAHKDLLRLLTDPAAVLAYDVTGGW